MGIIGNNKINPRINVSLFMFGWDRWIRTIGMTESKSVALPLGYIPV